jgi:hypothetical protein
MRYALLIHTDESAVISPEERSRRAAAGDAGRDRLRARGVLAGAEQLLPAETATTVRAWDGGDVVVTAGPAKAAREQLTGIYLVECRDLGEAVEVATAIPAAWYGSVEIRPAPEPE